MTDYTIGVDISKAHLDVYRLPDGACAHFGNNAGGFRDLIKWIDTLSVERIVYEPTGSYHLDMEAALARVDLPLVKVNPLHAKRFAQACGTRTKTDEVDARMLARLGVAMQPDCTRVPSPIQRDLKALQIARMALIKDRTAAKNRTKQIRGDLLRRQNAKRLRQIENDLQAIEQAMLTLIKTQDATARTFQIVRSIPGIGDITAAALLIELPELGTLAPKKVASLAGLAPYTRQSGQWKGNSFIGAGRKFLRNALYMPAVVACRHNPDMKTKYQQLINAGKPAKVAITAIMRKMIILANALIRDDRIWAEKPA